MCKEISRCTEVIRQYRRDILGEGKKREIIAILRRLVCYSEKIYGIRQMVEELPDKRKRPRIKAPKILIYMLDIKVNYRLLLTP